MLICADTFVDDYVQRIARFKPDLVLVPYGWAAEVDKWPQHEKDLEHLVARRAKEWNCPVVGTDLVGVIMHGPWTGQTYGGGSVVADASGQTVAVLRDRDVEVRVVEVAVTRHN